MLDERDAVNKKASGVSPLDGVSKNVLNVALCQKPVSKRQSSVDAFQGNEKASQLAEIYRMLVFFGGTDPCTLRAHSPEAYWLSAFCLMGARLHA